MLLSHLPDDSEIKHFLLYLVIFQRQGKVCCVLNRMHLRVYTSTKQALSALSFSRGLNMH